MLRLLFLISLLTLAFASCLELRQRHAAEHLFIEEEPLEYAEQLRNEGRLDEARLLVDFAADTALSETERKRAAQMKRESADDHSLSSHANSFIHGALSGEPRDISGFLGSLSLDLFVIGDIRDLIVQGYRELLYGDGDLLILGLAAVGLTTTMTPYLDFAPSLAKQFGKSGKLSNRFTGNLVDMTHHSTRTGNYKSLYRVASDLGRGTRALGPAPMSNLIKYVDEPAELRSIANLAEANPAAVYGLTSMTGRNGVKALGKSRDAGQLSKAARRGSRTGKTIAKAFSTVPDWALTALFLTAIGVAALIVASMLPKRRRYRSKTFRHEPDIPWVTQRIV